MLKTTRPIRPCEASHLLLKTRWACRSNRSTRQSMPEELLPQHASSIAFPGYMAGAYRRPGGFGEHPHMIKPQCRAFLKNLCFVRKRKTVNRIIEECNHQSSNCVFSHSAKLAQFLTAIDALRPCVATRPEASAFGSVNVLKSTPFE
jgi:hypothetical protein